MNGRFVEAGDLGFDAFGTACGLAVVAGALALVEPAFGSLAVTLLALAIVAWASLHRRSRVPPRPLTGAHIFAFALLGVAIALAAAPIAQPLPGRSLLLGLGAVPLWLAERRPPPRARARA